MVGANLADTCLSATANASLNTHRTRESVALHCLYPFTWKCNACSENWASPKVCLGNTKCLGWLGLSGRPGTDAFIRFTTRFTSVLKLDNLTQLPTSLQVVLPTIVCARNNFGAPQSGPVETGPTAVVATALLHVSFSPRHHCMQLQCCTPHSLFTPLVAKQEPLSLLSSHFWTLGDIPQPSAFAGLGEPTWKQSTVIQSHFPPAVTSGLATPHGSAQLHEGTATH